MGGAGGSTQVCAGVKRTGGAYAAVRHLTVNYNAEAAASTHPYDLTLTIAVYRGLTRRERE
jgi:hypothetical protein